MEISQVCRLVGFFIERIEADTGGKTKNGVKVLDIGSGKGLTFAMYDQAGPGRTQPPRLTVFLIRARKMVDLLQSSGASIRLCENSGVLQYGRRRISFRAIMMRFIRLARMRTAHG